MRTLIIVIPVILILTLISCGDKATNPPTMDKSTFIYPFAIGTKWNYSNSMYYENVQPDSIKYRFPSNSIIGTGTITILNDTVINSIPARCFYETYVISDMVNTATAYYINTDSALLCLAWSNIYGQHFPYKLMNGIKIKFDNKTYDNVFEMYRTLGGNTLLGVNPIEDSLIIENPPVACVSYPITEGKQWLFKSVAPYIYTYKKYIDFENLTIGSQQYTCIKTQRIYLNSQNQFYYDYISKFGEVKKDYLITNITALNEFGQPIGKFDSRNVITVTSITIPSK